ncbi:MAG: endonuclease III [Patescibacteria group bacterium]|nr:MAG: endonuclease III [Patescibacteria group bacterium]
MLQQTQVNRVIPKYLAFVSRFPNVEILSQATLSEVLSFWQGLGYNRRAKFLWQLAQVIKNSQSKQFPQTEVELQKLPGIGSYTASAIITFAYNQPTIVIETNVRSVFLYHFFPDRSDVPDSELFPLIQQSMSTQNPREWYWALMDYGSYLKKVIPNPSRKSKHHTKQSKFQGSLRQVRGEIIKYLTQHDSITNDELQKLITGNKTHFSEAIKQLLKEKLVIKNRNRFSLP